ncbi:Mur ligase family protein [bacterium]|nr:Mur ligase family protein [bacterium]
MNRVRFYTALVLARLTYLAIKLLHRSSGTSFVGMMTLKVCPDFLAHCRKYIKNNAITISGTNGKTTTSGLVAHIFEENQNSIIHNVKGANMLTGIANVFALNIKPFKRFDYAVIESDEAYLTKLYDYFKADYLLVTNLFRDQLDRYGELSTTASFIQNAIDKNKELKLILNADDPLVTNFGKEKNAIYYGFEEVEFCSEIHNTTSNAPTEVFNCICGKPLQYNKQFFAQEGHYYCAKCGFKRPEPNYKGYVKIYSDYSELKIKHNDKDFEFKINLVGLYNAYNVLGAVACAMENGIDYQTIKKAVSTYKSIFGRAERRIINGHKTLIQLIKNPTGASEVLKTVDLSSNIVIAINDNYADGRDISWLWDSDFEQLKNAQKLVITSGIRAKDMATRLKYAGIPQEKIIVEEDIKSAIALAAKSDNIEERITILPSYTALLKISKMKF